MALHGFPHDGWVWMHVLYYESKFMALPIPMGIGRAWKRGPTFDKLVVYGHLIGRLCSHDCTASLAADSHSLGHHVAVDTPELFGRACTCGVKKIVKGKVQQQCLNF